MRATFFNILSFLLFISCTTARQQEGLAFCYYSRNQHNFKIDDLCIKYEFSSSEKAEDTVEEIMSQVGLTPNFIVKECANIGNAGAVIDRTDGIIDTVRYLLINRTFLEGINLKSKTNWAAVSVIAHEIAHHLNGHTLSDLGSRPSKELECDEFAGFILKKMGASLDETLAGIRSMPFTSRSETHPPTDQRISALEKGWKNAHLLDSRYQAIALSADYSSIAKKWFQKGFEITADANENLIDKIACYTKAIQYKENFPAAYRNRAKYYNELKLYKQALNDAQQAILFDSTLWSAYSEKGTAYLGLGYSRLAIREFSKAIEYKEVQDHFDFLARGTAFFILGDHANAKSDFQEALKLKPGWQIARNKLQELEFYTPSKN
ncbi:MAG: hypothetical protein AAFQ94_03950 [Bacteroidota bacterium]